MQENDVEREFQIHRTKADYSLAEFWKWTLALLIGLAMGILGFAVDWGIEKLNDFKYDSTVSLIRGGGQPLWIDKYPQTYPCTCEIHYQDRQRHALP